MGSKSSSSSSSTTATNQEDNRVAATDSAIALGKGAALDLSQNYTDSPITLTSLQTTADADIAYAVSGAVSGASIANSQASADSAEAFSRALSDGLRQAGETSREAISANKAVSTKGLDLAGAVADDGFDITRSVVNVLADTAAEVIGTVDEAARSNATQSYQFAGRVLEGYEDARLTESERKFNQVMTAAMALGLAGMVAWAYVRGR